MTTSHDASETRTGEQDPSTAAPGAVGPDLESVPDVGFNISSDGVVTDVIDPAEQSRQLAHRIARELMSIAPEGWHHVDAAFSLTVTGSLAHVVFHDDQQRQARISPSQEVLSLVAEHREVAAQLGDGPWWRLLLSVTTTGELTVDHDYGDEPFPDDQLFAPQDYLADLGAYPRAVLPTWLGAYVRHDNRQSRTPKQAAVAARADRESGVLPALSQDDFPDLPLLWARWSAIAAAFVAVGSDWGPRALPSFGWFEGSRRSGSSLYVLPGGRAVLSGGVWDAPELSAAYNGRAPLPQLYSGAPEWVANSVVNARAAGGLLSFCYWWERGRWYRGESPAAADLAAAVPGIWTPTTVADVIAGLVAEDPTPEQRTAIAEFVAAAERGDITRALLAETFGPAAYLDEAHYQLTLAGLIRTDPDPLPESEVHSTSWTS
ncbi:hypothetical protein [Nocardia sp. NPDC006630]|uniref:hypothetical protein n=1 Tax=Nocardia sp. NPDC006630 TaxID=3157181 RepID=UPI0033A854E7